MKITNKQELRIMSIVRVGMVPFDEVEAFFVHSGLLYRKMNRPPKQVAHMNPNLGYAQVVETGDLHDFCLKVKVKPVDVEITVNPRRWWEFWK